MASPSCLSRSASSRPVVIDAVVVAPLIAYRGDRRALLVAYIVLTDAVVLRQLPRNVA